MFESDWDDRTIRTLYGWESSEDITIEDLYQSFKRRMKREEQEEFIRICNERDVAFLREWREDGKL